MRSLSSALLTALGGSVTRPAYLVHIGWNVPVRLSSHGTVSWNGYTWSAADLSVDGVRVGAGAVSGQLVLGNLDDVYGALVLNEGVADVPVTLYGFDAAATASGDMALLGECVGGEAEITVETVTIALRDPASFLFGPRQFIGPATGFTQLIAAGKVLNINGQSYRIARG